MKKGLNMLDLEQRFDIASRELRDELGLIHLAPPSSVIRRHRRRRVGSTLATGFAVAGLIAGGVTITRDVDGTNPASNQADALDEVTDALLYPSRMIGGAPDEVMFGPQYGYGPRALLSSPDGTLFVVTLTERLSTELASNADRRVFNDRTYTAEQQGGELAYTSVDDCTTVSIRQSSPDARPFDSNASALLGSLKVSDRHATVELTDGWASFGVGRVGTLIQIAFHSSIGGGNDQFNLMQLPDSSVASLIGLAGAPITQTAFNGQPAWTAQSGTPFASTSLAWQDGPNAVLLYSDTSTLDDLKQVAQTLQHDHGDQFEGHLGNAEQSDDAPLETLPTMDSMVTTNDPTNTGTGRCGTLQLTVQ